MARPERFELPTTWFVARYSIQLSYGRLINLSVHTSLSPSLAPIHLGIPASASPGVKLSLHWRGPAQPTELRALREPCRIAPGYPYGERNYPGAASLGQGKATKSPLKQAVAASIHVAGIKLFLHKCPVVTAGRRHGHAKKSPPRGGLSTIGSGHPDPPLGAYRLQLQIRARSLAQCRVAGWVSKKRRSFWEMVGSVDMSSVEARSSSYSRLK